jgi:hypothetical protein
MPLTWRRSSAYSHRLGRGEEQFLSYRIVATSARIWVYILMGAAARPAR